MKNSFRNLGTAVATSALLSLGVSSAFAEDNAQKMDHNSAKGMHESTDASQRARMDGQNQTESMKEANKILTKAKSTYSKLIDETGVPRSLTSKADCVAVVPNVSSTALLVGRQSGEGVISCKTAEQKWSDPAFIEVSKTSIGAQVGKDSKDMVFFIVGDSAVENFTDGTAKFGADLNVTAGPIGKNVQKEIGTGVYSYITEEKGLFAGISLTGGSLSLDEDMNEAFYGRKIEPKELLKQVSAERKTTAATEFIEALPESSRS